MRSSRAQFITTKQRTFPRACEFLSYFWRGFRQNIGYVEVMCAIFSKLAVILGVKIYCMRKSLIAADLNEKFGLFVPEIPS
jgi:hypothetical protein